MRKLSLAFIASGFLASACQISLTQNPSFEPRYDWDDVSRLHGYGEMAVELFDASGQPITDEAITSAMVAGLNRVTLDVPVEFVAREKLSAPQSAGLRLRLTEKDYPALSSKMCDTYSIPGQIRDLEEIMDDQAQSLPENTRRLHMAYCYSDDSWVDTKALYVIHEGQSLPDILMDQLRHSARALLPAYNPLEISDDCQLPRAC